MLIGWQRCRLDWWTHRSLVFVSELLAFLAFAFENKTRINYKHCNNFIYDWTFVWLRNIDCTAVQYTSCLQSDVSINLFRQLKWWCQKYLWVVTCLRRTCICLVDRDGWCACVRFSLAEWNNLIVIQKWREVDTFQICTMLRSFDTTTKWCN